MEIGILSLWPVFLVGLILVAVLVWVIVIHNRLIRQRNRVRASWAQIDVQLKRRHDLIPNLVEAVRGYAAHERATLEAVVAARNSAIQATNAPVGARAGAENVLTQALGRIFALAEGYPQLQASGNFLQLQRELAATEDKLAYARQFYNIAVQALTNTIQTFPSSLVASLFRFQPPEYFEAAGEERGRVQIRY